MKEEGRTTRDAVRRGLCSYAERGNKNIAPVSYLLSLISYLSSFIFHQ